MQHLQKLRVEIKAHIKVCVAPFSPYSRELTRPRSQNVQNDTGKLATGVAKERELSSKLVSELATNISIFKNTPLSVTSKSDPYVALPVPPSC